MDKEIFVLIAIVIICSIAGGLVSLLSEGKSCPEYTERLSEDQCVNKIGEITPLVENKEVNFWSGSLTGTLLSMIPLYIYMYILWNK